VLPAESSTGHRITSPLNYNTIILASMKGHTLERKVFMKVLLQAPGEMSSQDRLFSMRKQIVGKWLLIIKFKKNRSRQTSSV
jgi:hypothetical protein